MAAVIESYPPQFEFPFGTLDDVPAVIEAIAILELCKRPLPEADWCSAFRSRLSLDEVYDLLIFGVRSAIVAARTESPESLRVSLVCIVIDDNLADWRDMLVVLSILERCAQELKLEFGQVIGDVLSLATQKRRELIRSYLSRDDEMREVDVMGYVFVGTGREIGFARRQ